MVNSRSCNLEVRWFWVRVGSFCEYRFPKCSVQMFGSWMAMCLAALDLSKLFHNSQKIILINLNLVELYFHVISFFLY